MTDPHSKPTRRRLLSWFPRIIAGGALTAGVVVAMRHDPAAPAHTAPCVGQGLCRYCASSAACIRPAAQSYRQKIAPPKEHRHG